MQIVEQYLSSFEEIEEFECSIYGPQSGSIIIWFKPGYELEGFPGQLKNQLESLVSDLGSTDWVISGVGRAFDNSVNYEGRNSRIVLYGYNLEMLKRYAFLLRDSLQQFDRVERIYMNGRETYESKPAYEQILTFNNNVLTGFGVNRGEILQKLSNESTRDKTAGTYIDSLGNTRNVVFQKSQFLLGNKYSFMNSPVETNKGTTVKLSEISNIHKSVFTVL